MNILHISEADGGGAGIAAYRVHRNLKSHGFNSKLLVLKKSTGDDDVVQVTNNFIRKPKKISKITNRILKLLRLRKPIVSDKKYCFNGFERKTYLDEVIAALPFQPDAIILYWVTYYLNSIDIYNLYKKTKAPIFWYLMDMAPMAGGCHYAWDCNGYKNNCGQCPAIYSSNKNDITYHNLDKKKKFFPNLNLNIIAASETLYRQVMSSTVFKNLPLSKVLLSVDDKVFKPRNKDSSRGILNLPLNSKILFIGSDSLDNERKGMKFLIEALHILKTIKDLPNMDNILLLIAGKVSIEILEKLPFSYTFVGMLKTDEELANCYCAADFFICPSVEDSGPMMINEAIMCGTPIVSFEIGVALDLVTTGQTGYLAKKRDVLDFAHGIEYLLKLKEEKYLQMSNNCRELGLSLCHPHEQTEKLLEIINNNLID